MLMISSLLAAFTMALIPHEFKGEVKSVYSMKDLRELKFCLGIEITRDRSRRLLANTEAEVDGSLMYLIVSCPILSIEFILLDALH